MRAPKGSRFVPQYTAVVLLLAAAAALTVFPAVSWFSISSSDAAYRHIALSEGQEIGAPLLIDAKEEFDRNLLLARMIAGAYEGMHERGVPRRDTMTKLLKNIVRFNPNLVGAWAGFQKDAFDGGDAAYIGTEGADKTGRFMPYAHPGPDGSTVLDLLIGMDDQGADGAFYQRSLQSGRESVIEPYSFDINGRPVIMTSLTVPIVANGRIVGVAGVDVSLDELNQKFKANRPYKTGSVSLISSGGLWAVTSLEGRLGKPIVDSNPAYKDDLPRIAAGESFTIWEQSRAIGSRSVRVYLPLAIGKSGRSWSVMVRLPADVFASPASERKEHSSAFGIPELFTSTARP